MTEITFKTLSLTDITLMHRWFNMPHVQKFYSLRHWNKQEVLKKLKPYISGEKPVSGFIIFLDERPIGYVQSYRLIDFPWEDQDFPNDIVCHAAGMDLFIGNPDWIWKGLGFKIIHKFLDEKIWPKFRYCVVDPSIENKAAIRCYEKLGFIEHKIIHTKDALGSPTTLKLMINLHDK